MTDTAPGTGAALDATVRTTPTIAELEGMLAEARIAAERNLLQSNLDNARAKVAKIEGHLADAKQAVADAEAALAAAGKEN